ncbi:MAG: hypothetical protein ISS70_21000 [Phycisphaerae bacterium]|nr:hypothetical protein [Phycisphaerae bacterium]
MGSLLEIALVATGKIKQYVSFDRDDVEAEADEKGDADQIELEDRVTETVLLKTRQIRERERLAILLPSPFGSEELRALAVAIEINPPPKESGADLETHALCFNRCIEDLGRWRIGNQTSTGGRHGIGRSDLEDTIGLLYSPLNERRALLYLAQQTDASLAADIALSGTEVVFGSLSRTVKDRYLSGMVNDAEVLGWTLERSSYRILADLLSADQVTPQLEAMLVRHIGQVGRHVSTLEELLASSGNTDEFRRSVVSENFIYLEDISPAARTRAFEWLAARGKAPDGYDPLAPLKQRRAALRSIEKGLELR